MPKQEFLNFEEISKLIPFSDVLNWLNIPYQKNKKELRGDGFIVSLEKNLFFTPKNETIQGSVINFVAHRNQISLREAASLLKKQFLTKSETNPIREMPQLNLLYDQYLEKRFIKPELAAQYEVGFVKQKSIVSGRIAFKIYDHEKNHTGYIGYKVENNNWLFPKNFSRPLYNVHNITNHKYVIVTTDPFDTLRIISMNISQVVSLLASTMTDIQEQQLKKFRYILLLHHEPANIVNRLFNSSFIKAPVLYKSLQEMTSQELQELIKPS